MLRDMGTLIAISSKDLAALPIDQAESQRPGRPVEARGLANGLGRVGGAQVDLLQDRRAAFGREAQKLKPKQGSRRAFGDDPNELLDRISFRVRRMLDWSGLFLSEREVGVR